MNIEFIALDKEHLEWARQLHNDPEVLAMLTDPTVVSPEQQLAWFDKMKSSKSSQRLIVYLDSAPIGIVRIDQIDYANRSVCVGLDIHKDFRGKGYAKLIYSRILTEWFSDRKFHRVWLMVAAYNNRARNLYKSLGFLEENVQREALLKDGKFHDYYGMSILEDTWEAINCPRKCNRCGETKAPDLFFRLYRRSRIRLQNICKTCQVKKHKEYCERNKEDRRLYKRRSDLKKKYGLTIEAYNEMLVAQEFSCAICREPEKYSTSNSPDPVLAVDHDHITNKVRGLLCSQCNQAVGKFKDDIEIMESAIEYLKRNR